MEGWLHNIGSCLSLDAPLLSFENSSWCRLHRLVEQCTQTWVVRALAMRYAEMAERLLRR
ncbi:hypothetical protein DFR28_101755 [Arenicella xantha]|uniref:Uncharacterized protein n=1 Tax=Arenicella xantha TaxID=644221 RepID=A0A395JP32_9GAMM|nr:hypothetical protein DFR28_101755 [Arenicella xantha]